jgi:hypothetical protein
LNGVSGIAEKNTDGSDIGNDDQDQVSVSYRGIEDLWGNVWEFIDGINVKDGTPYIADHGFAINKYTEPYQAYTDASVALPTAIGYISDFTYDASNGDWLLLPRSIVDSIDNTGIPDLYDYDIGGKVVRVGGAFAQGNNVGMFNWYVSGNYGSQLIGARIQYKP